MPDPPDEFDPAELFGDDAEAGRRFTRSIEDFFRAEGGQDPEARRRGLLEKYKAAKDAARARRSPAAPPLPPLPAARPLPPLPPLPPLTAAPAPSPSSPPSPPTPAAPRWGFRLPAPGKGRDA
jgi:hypothetical protein